MFYYVGNSRTGSTTDKRNTSSALGGGVRALWSKQVKTNANKCNYMLCSVSLSHRNHIHIELLAEQLESLISLHVCGSVSATPQDRTGRQFAGERETEKEKVTKICKEQTCAGLGGKGGGGGGWNSQLNAKQNRRRFGTVPLAPRGPPDRPPPPPLL